MPKRKRAVSEVISSLILLMIVSVLGTYLYTYTLNSTGFQRNIIEGDIERKSERAQEKFCVTAVWLNNISDLMNLTILNFGRLDIKIAAIYINGERVTDYVSGFETTIVTSDLKSTSFTPPLSISSGALYEIVVVSKRGVSHVFYWKV